MARYRRPALLERRHGYTVIPQGTVKLLSNPSKMPGRSFGIPALGIKDDRLGGVLRTCPSAVTHVSQLDNASDYELVMANMAAICGGCYAMTGRYAFPNVKDALRERVVWTHNLIKDDSRSWVEYMAVAIVDACRKIKYFRIHDAGDMYSPEYAQAWLDVIVRVHAIDPEIRFWLPTRAWYISKRWDAERIAKANEILRILRLIAAVGNTAVRPSALVVGFPPPKVPGLHAGTSVQTDGSHNCPAHTQNNECRACRTCWDPTVPVGYRGHSKLGA